MREVNLSRERMVWAAVVVALATSASWLAAISVALLARQSGVLSPETLAAGRALFRVAWLLIRYAAPVALVPLIVSLVVALAWAQRHDVAVKEEARHA